MKRIASEVKDLLKTLLVSILIVVILRIFIMVPVAVEGRSMQNTLYDGDHGFSFIVTKNLGVSRFDIVIIDSDKSNDKIVKRVIGLPGEEISCFDNNIYINGEYLEEDFLNDAYTSDFSYILGEDEYFCLGDNRGVSKDSRYYGPFSKEDFLASHVFVIWPLSNFGWKN